MSHEHLTQTPLGDKSDYPKDYDPHLLFPIARELNRHTIGIADDALPFQGQDAWTAYEISWLNPQGKPCVAIANFVFPCNTPHIIESKSFKLYLNSFNQTSFASIDIVKNKMFNDLSRAAGGHITVDIHPLESLPEQRCGHFSGVCLDPLDITVETYHPEPDFLTTTDQIVTESVFSHLLKSNCPVTHQPDWGSVFIQYTGNAIDHAGLLRYIISYRDHNEFHEHCVEQMFIDLMQRCAPEQLTVYARYTRRGGLDINPFRSTTGATPPPLRLIRQ